MKMICRAAKYCSNLGCFHKKEHEQIQQCLMPCGKLTGGVEGMTCKEANVVPDPDYLDILKKINAVVDLASAPDFPAQYRNAILAEAAAAAREIEHLIKESSHDEN
jgi:hypothetical protein